MNCYKYFLYTLLFTMIHSSANAGQLLEFQVDGQSKNPIVLSFEGEIYGRGNDFVEIKKKIDSDSASEIEEFLYRYIENNKASDKNNILSQWSIDSRPETEQQMLNEVAWRANHAFHNNITNSIFFAELYYGNYSLAIVQHTLRGSDSKAINVYPVLKTLNGGLAMDNGLYDNFFFYRLSDSIAEYMISVDE